ncbi:MAG: hypothetical protein NXY57DRAFT_865588, partial [Lentinula lateritia]
ICELRGTDQVFNTDHDHWNLRDVQELRHWANAYKNATNLAEQTKIWEDHGVRWSSLWLLDYWNPTTMLVIDSMHCLLEGLIQYHCRHVLRLDASSTKISSDGLKYAFDWPWIPYDHDLVPNGCPRLSPKHIPRIANIHQTLCLALEGAQALTLDAMWTRLENGAPRDALRFVAHTLSLPTALNDIHEQISSTYVKRARKHFTADKDAHQKIFPFSKPATQKNHFIALLLNWRIQQPLSSDASILPTGTPETLAHIQHVIRHTTTPSWLNSVPKNYGDAKAGSIKADEWRTLSTVYLPLALITLWGDNNGHPPPADNLLLKALNHTMALFQAT